ncbi:hypothetical protein BJX63DRAFT_373093 [Aspergillus granulosus]|uniref:Uncharacterized protein n=1 Tax=Aspergillus granulosus TaxID=176169 RepID=A0ABR4H2I4_9EURO
MGIVKARSWASYVVVRKVYSVLFDSVMTVRRSQELQPIRPTKVKTRSGHLTHLGQRHGTSLSHWNDQVSRLAPLSIEGTTSSFLVQILSSSDKFHGQSYVTVIIALRSCCAISCFQVEMKKRLEMEVLETQW